MQANGGQPSRAWWLLNRATAASTLQGCLQISTSMMSQQRCTTPPLEKCWRLTMTDLTSRTHAGALTALCYQSTVISVS